nr:hypothetical protein [Candidatus Gracilibacteria bacterium]
MVNSLRDSGNLGKITTNKISISGLVGNLVNSILRKEGGGGNGESNNKTVIDNSNLPCHRVIEIL